MRLVGFRLSLKSGQQKLRNKKLPRYASQVNKLCPKVEKEKTLDMIQETTAHNNL